MSDAVGRKLSYPHPLIQSQGVEQLLIEIRKKHLLNPKGNLYENEVDILWKNCCLQKNNFLSKLCSDAILSLVSEQILNPNVTLKTAVNYTASSTYSFYLIHVIHQLLVRQFTLECDFKAVVSSPTWKAQYKLRSPTHPLISVLLSNAECLPAVCSTLFLSLESARKDNDANRLKLLDHIKAPLLYMYDDNSKLQAPLADLLQYLESEGSTNSKSEYYLTFVSIIYDIFITKEITYTNVNLYLELLKILKKFPSGVKNYIPGIFLKVCRYVCHSSDSITSNVLLNKINNWIMEIELTHWTSLLILNFSHFISTVDASIFKSSIALIISVLKKTEVIDIRMYVALMSFKSSLLGFSLLTGNKILKSVKSALNDAFELVDEKTKEYSSTDSKENLLFNCNHDQSTVKLKLTLTLYCDLIENSFTLKSFLNCIENYKSLSREEDRIVIDALCILILHGTAIDFPDELFNLILNSLVQVSRNLPVSSLYFVPVILHCFRVCNQPQNNLSLLYTLPNIVHYHSSLPIVLNSLKMMAKVDSMLPLVIRLLIDLWKHQDRCFTTLQNLTLTGSLKASKCVDLAPIQSLAVREICATRPYQYASEMLQLITSIVNLSDKKNLNAAVALDGLYYLCDSESLDIVSTWDTLLKPIWEKSGGLVTERILKFLSLTQKMNLDTDAFRLFKSEIITLVWSKTIDKDLDIVAASLNSLSHFDHTEFIVCNLPDKYKPAIEKNEEDIENGNDMPIPGYCYLNILLSLPPTILPDYKTFLLSILHKEMTDMPRDIQHRAMRHQKTNAQPHYLDDIPGYILKMYERNKQPNLKPSLALALLVSHNPSHQIGADSKVIYRLSISRGRSFFQLLQTLLGEITLDPNDWQGILWVTKGWEIFMERCLTAMVEGRRSELEMQLEHNSSKDEKSKLSGEEVEEVQNKQFCAHLWCRDKIMQELSSSSKGNPAKQGNCVVALAGLATACVKLESMQQQSGEEDASIDSVYVSTNHWVLKVADTMMCIADENFKPPGRIFSWCQYNSVSQTGRLSTTQLGRICAFHGLPLILSALFPKHSVKVTNMLGMLSCNAFPEPVSDENLQDRSSNISRHSAIALGKFLGILVKEKFESALGQEALQIHDTCMTFYTKKVRQTYTKSENSSTDSVLDNTDDIGAIVGLGYFLSSIVYFSDNMQEKKEKLNFLSELIHQLEDPEACESQTYTNALCFTMSLLCASGTACGLVAASVPQQCLKAILSKYEEDTNQVGIANSLGTLANSLFFSGDETVMTSLLNLHSKWNKVLGDSKSNMRVKSSALIGIACLAGSNNTILPATQNPDLLTNVQYKTVLNNVIRILKVISGSQNSASLQSSAIIHLSHMALSYDYVSKAQSQIVPTSYSYLPETSALKYVFSMLQEIGKQGVKDVHLKIPTLLLSVISDIAIKYNLPPINIAGYLALFNKRDIVNEEIQNYSISIALSQSIKSPTAAAYVSNWISAPIFYTLKSSTKTILFKSLAISLQSQSASKLETLLSWCTEKLSSDDCEQSLAEAMLRVIKDCLQLKSQTPQSLTSLHTAVEKIFYQIPFDITNKNQTVLLCLIANCLSSHYKANDIVEKWKEIDTSSLEYKNHVLKSLFVRCYCTFTGVHPISHCNEVIEECSKLENIESRVKSLWIIATNLCNMKNTTVRETKHIEWLQEMMGFIKQSSHKTKNLISNKMVFFLLRVFASLVACWTNKQEQLSIHLITDQDKVSPEQMKFLWDHCLSILPNTLPKLLLKQPWDGIAPAIVEWLIYLHKHIASVNDVPWKNIVKQTLICMKILPVFQRQSIWTEAGNVVYDL